MTFGAQGGLSSNGCRSKRDAVVGECRRAGERMQTALLALVARPSAVRSVTSRVAATDR